MQLRRLLTNELHDMKAHNTVLYTTLTHALAAIGVCSIWQMRSITDALYTVEYILNNVHGHSAEPKQLLERNAFVLCAHPGVYAIFASWVAPNWTRPTRPNRADCKTIVIQN